MIVLAVDTATERVGCALGGVEGVLSEVSVTRGPRHAETLAPAIEVVCGLAGVALDDVSVVAVDVGPGLFTGLRVGVATAKATAHALRVPMVGLPSLDLLAHGVRLTDRLVAAVVDARRGEVFSALYRRVPGGMQRVTDYAVGPPEDLASDLEARREEVLLVGDGARRYADVLTVDGRAEVAAIEVAHPSAGVLACLAHARAVREEFVQPSEVQPLYLRKADAQISWERRDGAA